MKFCIVGAGVIGGFAGVDGATTPRATVISAALVRSGLKSPELDSIRNEIWLKLWGRLAGVPTPTIDAIFQATKLLTHVILSERVRVRAVKEPEVE